MFWVMVEKVSLPSLKTYASVSFVVLSVSLFYAFHMSSESNWVMNVTKEDQEFNRENISEARVTFFQFQNLNWLQQLNRTSKFMVKEPLCLWALLNMGYCFLLFFGTFVQKTVFGELPVSEHQNLKEKFWNFLFYKIIFVFGIINVQYAHEVAFWCAWFSVLGFLNLLTQLGKDRFKYLSFSPIMHNWNHVRLLIFLVGIFVISNFMFLICVSMGFFAGLDTFFFMAPECIQLNMRALQVILRYSLYIYEMRETNTNIMNQEKQGPIAHYGHQADLIFELAIVLLSIVDHLHLLVWSNTFLSIAFFIICVQLRRLFQDMQRHIRRHRNYLWIYNHMRQKYPLATPEELCSQKNCAICWEEMSSARRLPCAHQFHNSCLQSWLEQDTSCPICRTVLIVENRNMLDIIPSPENFVENSGDGGPLNVLRFEELGYSWLTNFAVIPSRISEGSLIQGHQIITVAHEIQQIFPHVPLSVIADDLRIMRAPELTVEKILNGSLIIPVRSLRNRTAVASTDQVERTFEPDSYHRFHENNSVEKYSEREDNSSPKVLFSNSSVEREKFIKRRKELLLLNARRKYLEKFKGPSNSPNQQG